VDACGDPWQPFDDAELDQLMNDMDAFETGPSCTSSLSTFFERFVHHICGIAGLPSDQFVRRFRNCIPYTLIEGPVTMTVCRQDSIGRISRRPDSSGQGPYA
jgi:hypothetical protein